MKNFKIRISKIDSIILRFFFVLFWIIAANLVVLYVFILFCFTFTEFSIFMSLSLSFFFKYKMESKFKILICRIKCHTLFAFDDLFEIVLNYFSP